MTEYDYTGCIDYDILNGGFNTVLESACSSSYAHINIALEHEYQSMVTLSCHAPV